MSEEIILARLDRLETSIVALKSALALNLSGFTPILASITTGGSFPRGQTGKIEGKGGNGCNVVVEVDVAYAFDSKRTVRDLNGAVITDCTTYKITVTVKVREENCPDNVEAINERTTSHVFLKEFCDGAVDATPTGGETKGFDGVATDTLSYPHGTKVKVERGKPQNKTAVTVTYPDGTTVSTVVP